MFSLSNSSFCSFSFSFFRAAKCWRRLTGAPSAFTRPIAEGLEMGFVVSRVISASGFFRFFGPLDGIRYFHSDGVL